MTTLSRSIEYLAPIIANYDKKSNSKPLFVGICGPQGSGKSYLTNQLTHHLRSKFPSLNILSFSMDDLYLTHSDQLKITEKAKLDNNELLQGRGLPGTHDLEIGLKIFEQILNKENPISVPVYNKSLFNGEGDRESSSDWIVAKGPIDVVIFEGWFNGFCPLSDDQLRLKYLTSDDSTNILKRYRLYHLQEINDKLKSYLVFWSLFDEFIYLQTDSIDNVYKWRLEQEYNLIKSSGNGMSDSQVVKFINRYMPIYELYYHNLCENGLVDHSNLRLLIDERRNLIKSESF